MHSVESVAPEAYQEMQLVGEENKSHCKTAMTPADEAEVFREALREAVQEGKSKNFQNALVAATRAKFIQPDDPTAEVFVAQAHCGLEHYKEALESFRRCKNLLQVGIQGDQAASIAAKCDQGIAICSRRLNTPSTSPEEDQSMISIAPPAFPRTPHLSFSPGVGGDDIVRAPEGVVLRGREVVITEKLDGGNCCFFQGKVYARTHAHETSLPWFSAAKQIAATIHAEGTLPHSTALFLENMEAVHSIDYGHLPSPVFVIAALRLDNATSTLLAWDELVVLARSLGLPTPPGVEVREQLTEALHVCGEAVLYRGNNVQELWLAEWAQGQQSSPSRVGAQTVQPEGFVVREAGEVQLAEWGASSSKYVRKGHVQTPADFHRKWKKASFDLPL